MTDTRHRTTFGNRFRFLVRFLGLTGVLLAPAGYALAADRLPDWPTALTGDALRPYAERLAELAKGSDGVQAHVGTVLFVAGVAAVLLLAVHEVFAGLFLVAGRKTAVGTNAAVQIGLAAALLIAVNAVSFTTHRRFDLTRYREFTLPADLTEELKKLRPDSPTTVVVLQLHKTAGTLSDKPDAFDGAAERKVVEKVLDLVGQLREFGPRFNVAVLDVQDEGYERQLKALTGTRPGLAEAIAAAPENSLFFYADGRPASRPAVARMSFTDFYQLDKTASKEAAPAEREEVAPLAGGLAFAPGVRGRGNLVLLPRGPEAFVRKVLSLEERKPKVGLAVIHPLLTSREGYDEYSAGGLRKALEANGFSVADIILKRWGGRTGGGPTPAADTFEEYEIDRVEGRYNLFTLLAADRDRQVKTLTDYAAKLNEIPLTVLDRQFGRQLGRPIRTEADRALIRQVFENTVQVRKEELVEINAALAELAPRYREVFANERAAEGRRQTDVKAKFAAAVADCDLLIVPRLTTVDLTRGDIIPPNLFNLAAEQAAVVKEFLAAGKPVLFAMGPTNVDRGGPGADGPDDVEKLLPQLGIELGKQTVLTPVEAEAMAERQNEALGLAVDLPPLAFDRPPPDGKAPNPVGTAFRVTGRAVDQKLELKKGGFRPVYVTADVAGKLPFAAEFAFSPADAWNEDRPLADGDYLPKYDPAKPDDPKRGTRDEEKRGSYPVGVAVEVPVPADWRADKQPGPAVRVVALGSGGLFTGKRLDPANETLLLHAVNWQLRRDDRLPQDLPDEAKWRFPRVDLSDRTKSLWRWGTFVGLPAVVVYLGVLTLMARKVR
jgi:hypothetical protein